MFLIHTRFSGRDIEAPFGTTVQYEQATSQMKRAA